MVHLTGYFMVIYGSYQLVYTGITVHLLPWKKLCQQTTPRVSSRQCCTRQQQSRGWLGICHHWLLLVNIQIKLYLIQV